MQRRSRLEIESGGVWVRVPIKTVCLSVPDIPSPPSFDRGQSQSQSRGAKLSDAGAHAARCGFMVTKILYLSRPPGSLADGHHPLCACAGCSQMVGAWVLTVATGASGKLLLRCCRLAALCNCAAITSGNLHRTSCCDRTCSKSSLGSLLCC